MHDVLSPSDALWDEVAQRRETGFDVEAVVAAARGADLGDPAVVDGLWAALGASARTGPWPYEEPDDVEGTVEALPAPAPEAPARGTGATDVEDRIRAAWLGRIAGCTLGKPVEEGAHWTAARIRDYLERAGAWPLEDYVPRLDPMPAGFTMRESWPETTRGRVAGAARDDDIDYSILGLHLLERHGTALAPEHVADAWLTLLPFRKVFTAEAATYRNLVAGVPPARAADVRNPYREWIGAQIRADAPGWVLPGQPRRAALLAAQDARLSHRGNGLYGAMWAAALVSSAFVEGSARAVVERSLEHVPPRSRLAEAVRGTLDLHAAGATWDDALAAAQQRYGHYSWVHVVDNAAVLVAGLLWGDGDYARTVGLTVSGGWDTDSNGATAGSVAGVLLGTAGLPARFTDPLQDRTRSALFGSDHARISDLAARTARLATGGLR